MPIKVTQITPAVVTPPSTYTVEGLSRRQLLGLVQLLRHTTGRDGYLMYVELFAALDKSRLGPTSVEIEAREAFPDLEGRGRFDVRRDESAVEARRHKAIYPEFQRAGATQGGSTDAAQGWG